LDKVLLVRIRDFWSEIEVLSNCKGFKLQEVSLQNFSIFRARQNHFSIEKRWFLTLKQFFSVKNSILAISKITIGHWIPNRLANRAVVLKFM
jgi:hypothetical protein